MVSFDKKVIHNYSNSHLIRKPGLILVHMLISFDFVYFILGLPQIIYSLIYWDDDYLFYNPAIMFLLGVPVIFHDKNEFVLLITLAIDRLLVSFYLWLKIKKSRLFTFLPTINCSIINTKQFLWLDSRLQLEALTSICFIPYHLWFNTPDAQLWAVSWMMCLEDTWGWVMGSVEKFEGGKKLVCAQNSAH